jgi:hypothetical protein
MEVAAHLCWLLDGMHLAAIHEQLPRVCGCELLLTKDDMSPVHGCWAASAAAAAAASLCCFVQLQLTFVIGIALFASARQLLLHLHVLLLLALLSLAAAAYYERPCFGCMRWGEASQLNCNNLQHRAANSIAQLSIDMNGTAELNTELHAQGNTRQRLAT